jgi:GNAT superfamily N-acetyltransferase
MPMSFDEFMQAYENQGGPFPSAWSPEAIAEAQRKADMMGIAVVAPNRSRNGKVITGEQFNKQYQQQKNDKQDKSKSYSSWDVVDEPVFDNQGNEISSDRFALIEKLWVNPNERNKGIGKQLLNNSIADIQKSDPNIPIKLSASDALDKKTDLNRLVNFYEKEGFTMSNQENGPNVIMEYAGKNRNFSPIEKSKTIEDFFRTRGNK